MQSIGESDYVTLCRCLITNPGQLPTERDLGVYGLSPDRAPAEAIITFDPASPQSPIMGVVGREV